MYGDLTSVPCGFSGWAFAEGGEGGARGGWPGSIPWCIPLMSCGSCGDGIMFAVPSRQPLPPQALGFARVVYGVFSRGRGVFG